MTVFYTSDTHFCHKNILQHENRPFNDIDEMDTALIEQWNKTVGKKDTVYHLGDFVFGGITKWEKILSQLNGEIHLVLENHDDKKVVKKIFQYFDSIENMIVRNINKQHLFLCHYPIEIGLTPNTYSIHGHIHSRPSSAINQINVGVDSSFTKSLVGFGNLIPEDLLLDGLPFIKEEIMTLRNSVKEEEK
ncbi:metallophosphoesterase [Paenibacillus sp. ISL-20]|uniref:metallophosphoesterase family protein n=1 Tax=Paenibacillus sp. ISL-20 TaxID=2819163 RepID=UPI001BEB5484|nr:metallophosphoesterase [Paenibacillus sp. ISL-20]MBT2760004.1 metallophosphoesterase family protein [Paenibacillus sp. ISL-20]